MFVMILTLVMLSCLDVVLASSLTSRSDDTNPLTALVAQQSQLITQLQAKLNALEAWKAQQSQHVAFNVLLTHNVNLTSGTVVKFDQVDLNLGNSYDVHTGIFTVPVSGLYEFSMKVASIANTNTLIARMVLDGVTKAEVRADSTSADRASADAILHVHQGQKLWVKADGTHNHVSSFSGSTSHTTTFMGVLIQAD